MAKHLALVSLGILSLSIAGQLIISGAGAAPRVKDGIIGTYDQNRIMLADGRAFDVTLTGFVQDFATQPNSGQPPFDVKDIKLIGGGLLLTKQGTLYTILHRKGNWQPVDSPVPVNQIKYLDGTLLITTSDEVWYISNRLWSYIGKP